MRVAVTGASGFIGKALCAQLSASGVNHAPLREPWTLDNFDAVVHLAGIAHRQANEAQLEAANVELAERVGQSAASAGARMIFVSSIKVHGDRAERTLHEAAALAPVDAYARSKARAEGRLRQIPGLALAVLRPPLIYGPGVRANFLALMSAIARGWPLPFASVSNRRSLLYVANLCDALTTCVQSRQADGRTFFVTDGAAVSTPELCRHIGAALGRRARLFRFPPRLLPAKLGASLAADDAAIRGALGWKPPFSFEEGLRLTAAWYRNR